MLIVEDSIDENDNKKITKINATHFVKLLVQDDIEHHNPVLRFYKGIGHRVVRDYKILTKRKMWVVIQMFQKYQCCSLCKLIECYTNVLGI